MLLMVTFQSNAGALATRIRKRPLYFGSWGKCFSASSCLRSPGLQWIMGDGIFLGPGMRTTAKTPGHVLQFVLVQFVVGAMQLSPPGAKAAALLAKRKVAIQHDPVDTVVPTGKEFFIVNCEIVLDLHDVLLIKGNKHYNTMALAISRLWGNCPFFFYLTKLKK